MQNHRRRPIVAHCGITSLRSSLPHLVYFPPSSSRPLPLFRLLSHPSAPLLAPPLSHFPYRSTKPVVLSATPPLPPFLPLSSASSFISSTSVFGSEPRLVPFQRHADKWISLLIKSFTRPRSFLSSSPPV